MFLNLKGKKYVQTINHQQGKSNNHPKTHRDQIKEKNSKEQKEIKSYRHPNGQSKKPIGSTAGTSLQPSNASFTNMGHHFKIKVKDQNQKDYQNLNKSQQKLDSHRLARVASAYKRIKRINTNEGSFNFDEMQKSQEKIKRTMNKPNKPGMKKQLLNNIVQNYICVTQGDETESKVMQKINSGRGQMMQDLLNPFLQLFSQSKVQKFKERSFSHRDLDMKSSLDKSGKFISRQRKKKSNQILIKDDATSFDSQSLGTIYSFVSKFYDKLDLVKGKLESIASSKKYKYVESPSINLFEKFYQDIEHFFKQFYEICLKQMDVQLKKHQAAIGSLVLEQQRYKKKLSQLQKVCQFQMQKSKMLQRIVQNCQDKSLYSTIFLNELSFSFDVDSHLRDKLYQQARKNGLVSQLNESQLQDNIVQSTRSLKVVGMNESNLFDQRDKQLDEGYNIASFGNCIDAKKKQDIKNDNI